MQHFTCETCTKFHCTTIRGGAPVIITAYGCYRNRFEQALDVATFIGVLLLIPASIALAWLVP
jgi:hypothetical protein